MLADDHIQRASHALLRVRAAANTLSSGASAGVNSPRQGATAIDLLPAALALAEQGVPVFPVWPIRDGQCACGDHKRGDNVAKHPIGQLVPHGLKQATTDVSLVTAWWRAYSDA
jgi:hypothetical protein